MISVFDARRILDAALAGEVDPSGEIPALIPGDHDPWCSAVFRICKAITRAIDLTEYTARGICIREIARDALALHRIKHPCVAAGAHRFALAVDEAKASIAEADAYLAANSGTDAEAVELRHHGREALLVARAKQAADRHVRG